MNKRSSNPQASAVPQTSYKSSGIVHSKSTVNNRKCVVVGQKMVKTELKVQTSDFDVPNKSDVRLSNTSLQSVEDSPTSSVRSSNSSFRSSVYSGLEGSIASRETKLLDELKSDIEATAIQLMKVTSEVENIPTLRKKVEDVEKEKRVIAESLSEKCEIIETMKQRLSVLHEQNSQLAQLTKSSNESSDTTLRMRNALVASLAQIKKLQAIVDEVPTLKAQISSLNHEISTLKKQEQDVLKHLLIDLPKGITSSDYHSLHEENKKLRSSNESLSNKIMQLSNNVEILTKSTEDMRKRADNFEKSISTSVPLTSRIKQLEKEKEDLYDEIIHLKLDKSLPLDIDTMYLSNECDVLRKTNSALQGRLEELAMQYKEQKEKIILKLFEIEVSGVESRKFEVDKQMSTILPATCGAVTPCDEDDVWATLSPEFKAQILKLHQCRLEIEQSHHITHLVLSEKEDLERKLADMNIKLDEKSIMELESKVKDYENKLTLARAKINDLEKRLRISSQSGGIDRSTLISENLSLKAQLSSLQGDRSHSMMITELKKQLSEEQRLQEVNMQKYKKSKEQRQKLEAKVKESKQRYQTLASELSDSVKLMKNYQVQCQNFDKEIEIVSAERENFRREVSFLKAELETLKAQYAHNTDQNDEVATSLHLATVETTDTKNIQDLAQENSDLKQRLVTESEEARAIIDYKTSELKILEERFKELDVRFHEAQKMLTLQESRSTAASNESSMKIEQLEAELKDVTKKHSALSTTKSLLEGKIRELSDETTLLSTKLSEACLNCTQLQSENKAKEDQYYHSQSLVKESEIRLSRLLTEIGKYKSSNSKLMADVSEKDKKLHEVCNSLKLKESEIEQLKGSIQNLNDSVSQGDKAKYDRLNDEIEGYKAIIKSLQRQLDEAETREIEHEILKHKIKKLEQSLGDSSHDNKALIELLHETVQEIPSFSDAEQSLQDHNLQLEEQISVLSQWNDTQRQEIEELERNLDESVKAYNKLIAELKGKDDILEENLQLKRELKEVEIEVNALRRQVRADMQEELQLKLEAHTQLLAVFNQHNTLLQRQVDELQTQVKLLGGKLDREKAVSPPPMPDMSLSLTIPSAEHHVSRSLPSLDKENMILKQRIELIEQELVKLHRLSPNVRRCSSILHALSSVSIKPVNEEVLITVPREMLLPCSLLADHLNLNASLDDPTAQSWIDTVGTEWFACVSQKSLTPACAQSYIATISRLSHKLLDIVINLQDKKGNTALHFTAANGNLPALNQFINLRSCDASITNDAGFNALMLLSACTSEVDVTTHREVIDILVERSGVNSLAKKTQQTALMLAASSGNAGLVNYFLEKDCDVNFRDKDGSTALMYAVQRGDENIVHILLSTSTCDVQIKDNEGQTAKDIARDHNCHAILSLLKRPKS